MSVTSFSPNCPHRSENILLDMVNFTNPTVPELCHNAGTQTTRKDSSGYFTVKETDLQVPHYQGNVNCAIDCSRQHYKQRDWRSCCVVVIITPNAGAIKSNSVSHIVTQVSKQYLAS